MYRGIALCGKAGTGKDTVMAEMKSLHLSTVRVSFADGVKDLAKTITGVNFFDDEVKQQPKNREFLQFLGTDLMRDRWDHQWWVKQAQAKCTKAMDVGLFPVLTDTRFPDEADMARDLGMYLVRLEATPETLESRGRPMTTHASETALDGYLNYDLRVHTDDLSPQVIAEMLLNRVLE